MNVSSERETARLRQAISLLREAEWASSIWTDTITCPWCGGLKDEDLPAVKNLYEFVPKGHRPDCRYVAFMKDE